MIKQWASRLFNLVLYFHPQAFRDEFGAEMYTVFLQRIGVAAEGGIYTLLWVCLHEIVGMIASLIHQHAARLNRGRDVMFSARMAWSLAFLGAVLMTRRAVASYFCDLANPRGGSMFNQMSCGIYSLDQAGVSNLLGMILVGVALVLLVRLLVLRVRLLVLRRWYR